MDVGGQNLYHGVDCLRDLPSLVADSNFYISSQFPITLRFDSLLISDLDRIRWQGVRK